MITMDSMKSIQQVNSAGLIDRYYLQIVSIISFENSMVG
jgi:hypothetical protein